MVNPSRFSAFALLLGVLCVSACSDGLRPVARGLEIEQARLLWESHDVEDYSVEVIRQCFCGWVGWVDITVRDGEVVSRKPVDRTVEDPQWLEYTPDIDTLFEILLDAQKQRAEIIDVEWDLIYGFPVRAYVDISTQMADEEQGFEVRNFRKQ